MMTFSRKRSVLFFIFLTFILYIYIYIYIYYIYIYIYTDLTKGGLRELCLKADASRPSSQPQAQKPRGGSVTEACAG